MFVVPVRSRSIETCAPSRMTFRTSTRRERRGQKAIFTETRSAESNAGLSQPGPFRTATFSSPAPRPVRISQPDRPRSTLR